MYDHQRIARRPITELLQEFIEDVVVAPHALVSFGNKILEEPRSLHDKDKFLDIGSIAN